MLVNKFHFLCLSTLLSAVSLSHPLSGASPAPAIKPHENGINSSQNDNEESRRLSEAFGHFIGRNLQNPGIDFDLELIIKGIRSGANDLPAPMPDAEYEQLMVKAQKKASQALSEKNLTQADAFFIENANTPGIVELESGKLQYLTLKPGNGDVVTQKSAPLINYTGKFMNGDLFSSSDQTGGPISIPLEQTIPGFQKGLLGMKEGEKRRLFVHPDLGYGTAGQLPPNSLLIFDIEVVKADADNQESPEAEKDGNTDFQWQQQ